METFETPVLDPRLISLERAAGILLKTKDELSPAHLLASHDALLELLGPSPDRAGASLLRSTLVVLGNTEEDDRSSSVTLLWFHAGLRDAFAALSGNSSARGGEVTIEGLLSLFALLFRGGGKLPPIAGEVNDNFMSCNCGQFQM
jgi:hypothetical protein